MAGGFISWHENKHDLAASYKANRGDWDPVRCGGSLDDMFLGMRLAAVRFSVGCPRDGGDVFCGWDFLWSSLPDFPVLTGPGDSGPLFTHLRSILCMFYYHRPHRDIGVWQRRLTACLPFPSPRTPDNYFCSSFNLYRGSWPGDRGALGIPVWNDGQWNVLPLCELVLHIGVTWCYSFSRQHHPWTQLVWWIPWAWLCLAR